MKIEVSDLVQEFIRACPPEPRRQIRDALRKLADEKGDIKALDRELEEYHRLRVRSYRIIFRYETGTHGRKIFCPFVEHRGVVYETFLNLFH